MLGASLVLLSHTIAPAAWANESFINKTRVNEIRLAQARFTPDQLPLSDLTNSSELQFDSSVRGRIGAGSIRHQGRLFSIYRFEGEAGQLIRLNVVGELASDRPSDRIQTGSLLVNPAVILLDPNGEIVAQQPEQANAANALIRMNLPTTGTYHVFVTSTIIGAGGRYDLTLQQIEQVR
ncbi:hypothetical protein [Leptolyngbya ohadii]|uniref:hypothetical protein n=1 Tax=Leptolyngbya ohadii TaxID=1962290 RepID=UPI000B599A29|nr:hypothetical protein [Leptolyngbya ohadii]